VISSSIENYRAGLREIYDDPINQTSQFSLENKRF